MWDEKEKLVLTVSFASQIVRISEFGSLLSELCLLLLMRSL